MSQKYEDQISNPAPLINLHQIPPPYLPTPLNQAQELSSSFGHLCLRFYFRKGEHGVSLHCDTQRGSGIL